MLRKLNRWLAPDPDYIRPPEGTALVKERVMAFLIGALAIYLASGVAYWDEYHDVNQVFCPRSSISHYYYAPVAGTFFVMTLSFVGAFMIAYRGENAVDGWLATIGGIGALLVAFFPTNGLGCDPGTVMDLRPVLVLEAPGPVAEIKESGRFLIDGSFALTIGDPTTQTWHMTGAVAMFAVLFVFSAVLFPRIKPEDRLPPKPGQARGSVKPKKKARNLLYWTMSAAMVFGIAMILWSDTGFARMSSEIISIFVALFPLSNPDYVGIPRPVYHGEMLALVAFGVSWMVKGRFWKSPFEFLFLSLRRPGS